LLGAGWYREEQRRRYHLLDSTVAAVWHGERPTLAALVAGARREGRPVAASMSLSPELRRQLAPAWALGGLAYNATGDTVSRGDRVDSARTRAVANLIERRLGFTPRGRDPAGAYIVRLLRCPASILQLGSGADGRGDLASLDSRCNFK
jgi:hypothetical protein